MADAYFAIFKRFPTQFLRGKMWRKPKIKPKKDETKLAKISVWKGLLHVPFRIKFRHLQLKSMCFDLWVAGQVKIFNQIKK